MTSLIQLLSTLTISGSTIVVCLFVLGLFLPNDTAIMWRYRVGKMAVVFYLLPIVLIFQWVSSWAALNARTEILPSLGPNSIISRTNTISANTAMLFFSVWGIGIIGFASWQIYCYRKFLKSIRYTSYSVSKRADNAKLLALIKDDLGIQRDVRLSYSATVRSPVLIGLFKSTIYLPTELRNSTNANIDLIIRHELIHLKHNDLWVKAFVLGVNALHWFNPFVYILRRVIHIWSELSCDEEVVRKLSYSERKRYGETILNTMIGSKNLPVRFCSSLSGSGKQLKRRLNMVMHVKKLKGRTRLFLLMAIIVIGIISTSTTVLGLTLAPEVNSKTGELSHFAVEYSDRIEETSLDEAEAEEAAEMEMILVEEADSLQIQEYQQQFTDSAYSEFWAEADEDTPATTEIESTIDDAIEIEEVVFIESR